MSFVKSPLNYTGGKYKLLPKIIPLFPKQINTFVDLFCGGGNVGVNVECNNLILNDVESYVISTLEWMGSNNFKDIDVQINDLILKYGLTQTSIYGYEYYGANSSDGVAKLNKEGYVKLRADFNNGNKSPLMFYTMILFSFSNQIRFNSNGEFNMPVNKRDYNDSLKKNLEKFIHKLAEQNITFSQRDFREFKVDKLHNDDFVFLDPPYLITTASYNENGRWTEQDERDLYKMCNKLIANGIKFGLTNVTHHKGRVNEILIKWIKDNNLRVVGISDKFAKSYHSINNDASREIYVCNYWYIVDKIYRLPNDKNTRILGKLQSVKETFYW